MAAGREQPSNHGISFMLLLAAVLFAGCSLSYQQEQTQAGPQEPEFTFRNAVFQRYADNTISMKLTSSRIEQYKDTSQTFAKDAEFQLWNKDSDSAPQTEGNCKLMKIDPDGGIYTMFNEIHIKNTSREHEINAESLRWNKNSGQLTSGAEHEVHIIRKNMELTGSGFAADGTTKEYAFSQSVSGIIQTEESGEEP